MPPTALGKRHLPKTMGDVQASNLIRLPGPTEASPLPGSSHTLYQQEPLLPPQVPAGSCMEFGANTTVHDTTRPALPRFRRSGEPWLSTVKKQTLPSWSALVFLRNVNPHAALVYLERQNTVQSMLTSAGYDLPSKTSLFRHAKKNSLRLLHRR